jgi:PPK2 family polyphosphate:nucleotide phosphotransferase
MSKDHFKIHSAKHLRLSHIPTRVNPLYKDDGDYEKQLQELHEKIGELQTLLYAENSKALIIIFQGMDTAGKDGAISHVMSGVNPQGCQVVSFKTPTAIELEHDFLWRIHQAIPERGHIGIFNRSYYEETLITRVHPALLKDEKLPKESLKDKKFWIHRFKDIVNHEKYLHHQGFEIVKIFLHISKQEQKHRLLARFKDPKKLWKIDKSDISERAYWRKYQSAYENCFENTSTDHCPWYIVPGDDKKNARLIISHILISHFKKMNLQYPKVSAEQKQKLKKLERQLQKK